jgi:hypothetical protein
MQAWRSDGLRIAEYGAQSALKAARAVFQGEI